MSGRVQGVFYRASTQDTARRLLLVGWVRNLPGGGVEICAEGEEDRLGELLRWCRTGPPAARVDHVEPSWRDAEGGFEGFFTRY